MSTLQAKWQDFGDHDVCDDFLFIPPLNASALVNNDWQTHRKCWPGYLLATRKATKNGPTFPRADGVPWLLLPYRIDWMRLGCWCITGWLWKRMTHSINVTPIVLTQQPFQPWTAHYGMIYWLKTELSWLRKQDAWSILIFNRQKALLWLSVTKHL